MRVALLMLMFCWAGTAVRSQADFSGEWTAIATEANATDPQRGELGGLPLNPEGVRRAEIWDPEIESLPVWQCGPPAGMQLRLNASHLTIWKQTDGTSGGLVAFRVGLPPSVNFPIFMDQRVHPPAHARHTWGGFSTGTWLGDVLQIGTTHLKEGYYRRNGVPQSDLARFTEFLMQRTFRDENYLTWVVIAEDPIFLTEPLVRSGDYRRGPIPDAAASRCSVTKPANGTVDLIPSFLPGEDGRLDGFSNNYGLPAQIAADGAATMYPGYRAVIEGWQGASGSGSESDEVP